MVQRQIDVPLGDRSYPIYMGSEMGSSFAPTCRKHNIADDVVIITDRIVGKHYLRPLEKHLRHYKFRVTSVVIPQGEEQKNLQRANRIFTTMLEKGIGRHAAVIALGGGVVGDLAGFVAAIYQRGIQFIQVPTTLLAQVDSSVGGKVAVNHPLGKNMLGAFYQPVFVWSDIATLKTLPEREISCGMGEIIKYGVISDEKLFRYVEENLERLLRLETDAVMHVQARCCEIKSEIVEKDERESGLRMVLNVGHTVAHALEAVGGYKTLKHGEAVLLGMVAESFLARQLGMLDVEAFQRIERLIERVPHRKVLKSIKPSVLLAAMGRDKKAVGGKKRFVLPTTIGAVRVVEEIDSALLRSALKHILG